MVLLSNRTRVDPYLMDKIQSRRDRLFKAHDNRPQLKLTSIIKSRDANGRWSVRPGSLVKINGVSALRQVEETDNDVSSCIQIYTIRHLRSWTTLDISYETIEHLLAAHNVFDHFWRCILTFGIKFQENEYDFPPFRANIEQNTHSRVDELAYVIRRVEPNNSPTDKGVCPWSIRQTGVYHKMLYPNQHSQNSLRSTSVFILIAPSHAVEKSIPYRLSENVSQDDTFRQDFLIHECIVGDSLKGWMDYQAWLEAESKQIANRVLVLDILQRGNNGEPRSIYVSAEDRQRLKQLEDYITDMLVILQTMVESIIGIGKACRRHCQTSCNGTGSCLCNHKIERFEEYAAEAQTSLNRTKVLRDRVQSTEQLCLHLSDLLAYEEAAALTQLAYASRIESEEMVKLAAQSARDAAAVKVLTIIGLVYLPTTIVSNFFSTEFVHLNDKGNLQISRQVWILAVVSVPLTVLTIITWWLCDRYQIIEAVLGRKEECNLEDEGRRRQSEEGHVMYVPLSSLRELITVSKVEDILREEGLVQDRNAETEARRIVQTSLKLFAILVIRKRGADILRFLGEGISDTDLPFMMKPARTGSERMTLQTNGGCDIKVLSEWTDPEIKSLAKKQWRMLAPVFERGKHYDFPVAQILPFTNSRRIEIESGFSEVFQAFIHGAHHTFWDFPGCRDRQAVVAVKKLFSLDPSRFQIERDMHMTLRKTSGPHPHLINLLFTYKEGSKFHLVFPWADVNLRTYWSRIPLKQIDYHKVLWSLKQMTGLASALSLIHGFQLLDERQPGRYFGRHGDLKAENIVWFPSYPGCTDSDGILQITDLGLASLHSIGSVSNGDPAGMLGTKTYRPPDNHRNLRISRKWDLWSLGCLYLEFITWIVLGFDAIVEFAELRGAEGGETDEFSEDYFYTTDLRDVRPSVKAWVTRLSEDERCSDMLYDLLCLIMREMIRIEPKDRIDSQQLHYQLLNLLEQAESNGTYLVRASERSPI
ncbi:hypothetical protein KXW28_001138 [Aspergillus fumigatus]|nr:hypothetical protein KXX26_004554 [Aspergillus fumigatus]KAH2353343.1 hypothetical protein KXW30_006265 [Aspergillus fumigatus]KAH2562156.1 hypothetical protein KXV42_003918 [Aspergillus fumigatus]KAH3085094.1 hypothetical protein KXW28_001138 [Aspergillus fumigatus]